jgi:hypothetical protein
MRKQAQYSRKDLAVLYIMCVVLVFISVGTLYQIGILGDIKDTLGENLAENNAITAAAVVEPQEDLPQTDNQTNNSSYETNN